MTSIEQAIRDKQRVFVSRYYDLTTIRACPENYCLAHEIDTPTGRKWATFDDGAMKPYWGKIQSVIEKNRQATPEELATLISKVIPSHKALYQAIHGCACPW